VGGDDQVRDDLALAGRHQALVDVDTGQFARAAQGQLHHAAAGRALDLDRGDPLLGLDHALLHGLGLLHDRSEVLHRLLHARRRRCHLEPRTLTNQHGRTFRSYVSDGL